MNYIIQTLEPLYRNPKHCSANFIKLNEVAIQLAEKDPKAPDWRLSIFPQEDDDYFLNFLGVMNSINFRFTDFKSGNKFDAEYPVDSGKIWYGSEAMIACIKRALDDGTVMLNPHYLSTLTMEKAQKIFQHHTIPMPMLYERVEHLRSYGQTLFFSNEFMSMWGLFENAGFYLLNNGEGIIEKLIEYFWCYDDRSRWEGQNYLFYKRVQLLPIMYQGRALHSGGKLPLIKDPENFGAVTDYAVPNALRFLEIMEYSQELAGHIDAGREVEKGSLQELEIRAVTAQIMHKLLDAANQHLLVANKAPITMVELDSLIWSMGRKAPHKHHRTYTTAY